MTDSKTVDLNSSNSDTPELTPEVKTQLLDQLNAEQPSNRADVTEVFDRMNAASSLLDQVDREAETPATEGDAPPSDPSIEEYMAALLARSNGFSNEATPTQVLPTQEQPTVKKEPKKPVRPVVKTPPDEKRVQKPAPECRDHLSNMRKLANLNARSALDTHSGRRLIFEMHNKLTVAMVAIILSFGLITIATSISSLAYIGAVLALITSCAWTMRYLTLARQLTKVCEERSPQPPSQAIAEEEAESLEARV
jgi:hypothetical protein